MNTAWSYMDSSASTVIIWETEFTREVLEKMHDLVEEAYVQVMSNDASPGKIAYKLYFHKESVARAHGGSD